MSLADFSHRTPSVQPDTSHRVTAGLLTSFIYAVLALLVWLAAMAPPASPAKVEIVTTLLPDVRKKPVIEPPPEPDLIRPRAERPAPPVFTITSGAPPQAPAPLPATTTESPMVGGTAGNGPMGQAASGNGGNGNGGASGGCLDPVWMRAVAERVRQFFYYPGAALALRTTGVVTLRFGVRRNGQIDRLEVGTSSGDDGLDKAAIDIMRKAQPLPPIPDRMRRDRVDGELPINFGVRNFSGRASTGNCSP